jgi:hypothetical protein
VSEPALLPAARDIAKRLTTALSQDARVDGPEDLVNFKLKQVSRRAGGLLAVPLYPNHRDLAVEMGWITVGVRLAIAFGGLMLEDPEVKRKVGTAEPEDMQLDAAREILNITSAAFNLQLEAEGWASGVRVGELVQLTPDDVENRRLTLTDDAVTGLYKITFPGVDIPALTKRCGSLAVAFAPDVDDEVVPPRILVSDETGTSPSGAA